MKQCNALRLTCVFGYLIIEFLKYLRFQFYERHSHQAQNCRAIHCKLYEYRKSNYICRFNIHNKLMLIRRTIRIDEISVSYINHKSTLNITAASNVRWFSSQHLDCISSRNQTDKFDIDVYKTSQPLLNKFILISEFCFQ